MNIPIRCSKAIHHIIIEGGIIRLPDHVSSTLTLTTLLRNAPRCGKIILQYRYGAGIPQKLQIQTPHYVRTLRHLFWATDPLTKLLRQHHLYLWPFFSIEPDPFLARLVLGTPPSHPLLTWYGDANLTDDVEWRLAPQWSHTLSRRDTHTSHQVWGSKQSDSRYSCFYCDTTVPIKQIDSHLTSPTHLTSCETALTETLTKASPMLPRLRSSPPLQP